ncbi:hypothetical protein HWV62_5077 [Athelia sp. TMB]|nr:hypothetical protein HWV62_5077 [Athelia sp. TMB]
MDSFSDRRGWFADVKDVMRLVARMSTIAQINGHAMPTFHNSWNVYPLMVKPVQSNGYDCGVWTLAGIWAVLGGFEVTSHTEATIGCVQSCLLTAILSLPEQ